MAKLEQFLHIGEGDRAHQWINPDQITKIEAAYDSQKGAISSLTITLAGDPEAVTVRNAVDMLNILRQVGDKHIAAKDMPKLPKP